MKKVYKISKGCVACGSCKTVCPQHCISKGKPYTIQMKRCIGCGLCVSRCWRQVIEAVVLSEEPTISSKASKK